MFLKQFRWFAVALKYLFGVHIKCLKKFWFNFRIGVGEFPPLTMHLEAGQAIYTTCYSLLRGLWEKERAEKDCSV